MNIYEIAEKSKISVTKLRVLDKLGVLRHDGSATELDGIRETIRLSNKLSVMQLVHLVENPAGLLELGKYAAKAKEQLDALGNVKGQVAPREITARILEAFEKEPEAVEALIAWAKTVIPAHPVGHAYLGVRLLLGVPENVRRYEFPRLHRALMNCRDSASFDGWHRQEKSVSKNRTVYQKGTEIALDL